MKQFEDLRMWQEARILYVDLRSIFAQDEFRDYFFRDQILRATLSIGNNIAEGFERETNNELRRFLYIAKGSCGEVRSMIWYALDSGYINQQGCDEYVDRCKKISIMLYKYIKTL